MEVHASGYYAWKKRPGVLISADDLRLYRKAKELFKASRESLGSRELSKKLKSEGFNVGRERTRTIMKKLKLIVRQRVAYKVADSTHKCNSTFRNRGQAAVASLSFVPARMRGTDDYLHTAYPRATIPD